jgi:predicted nucleic acid-binding protein
MRILLDSNAYTRLERGHSAVAELVRRSEAVLVSTIVAGELLYGFRQRNRFEKNQRDFHLFLDNPYVHLVPVTFVTADRYSRVAASLRAKGQPIPTNDIWIAAHTMETGAELVSFDQHFQNVDGLAWLHLSVEP